MKKNKVNKKYMQVHQANTKLMRENYRLKLDLVALNKAFYTLSSVFKDYVVTAQEAKHD